MTTTPATPATVPDRLDAPRRFVVLPELSETLLMPVVLSYRPVIVLSASNTSFAVGETNCV